jgi:hypothetical protein
MWAIEADAEYMPSFSAKTRQLVKRLRLARGYTLTTFPKTALNN